MNRFGFRVWDKHKKEWIQENVLMGSNGELYRMIFGEVSERLDEKKYIIQNITGYKDKRKKPVFCGDIVKFKYFAGDFSWEFMTPEQVEENTKIQGKEFVGVVEWDKFAAGFLIICGDKTSTHTRFPCVYLKDSEIIGNIFEK